MMKLHARKEAIDIGRLGLQSGVHHGLTALDIRSLEDTVIRYAVAQAILDNINQTEGGLVVRDILVEKDLLDGAGTAITSRDWRQPVAGNFASATGAPATKEAVYTTGTNSRNDRKIYSFYGLQLVGVGPYRSSSVLKTNSIIWSRKDVKTIDIWPIETLDSSETNRLFGKTPLLFKRNDDLQIEMVPNAAVAVSSSKFERMAFLAKIVESHGSTVVG